MQVFYFCRESSVPLNHRAQTGTRTWNQRFWVEFFSRYSSREGFQRFVELYSVMLLLCVTDFNGHKPLVHRNGPLLINYFVSGSLSRRISPRMIWRPMDVHNAPMVTNWVLIYITWWIISLKIKTVVYAANCKEIIVIDLRNAPGVDEKWSRRHFYDG